MDKHFEYLTKLYIRLKGLARIIEMFLSYYAYYRIRSIK